MLWSQFAMASVPASDALSRAQLEKTRALDGSLLFIDGLPSEKGGFRLPMFGGGGDQTLPAPPVDASLLRFAAERGAIHAYLLLENEARARTIPRASSLDSHAQPLSYANAQAAIEKCMAVLSSLDLCATILAPEQGLSVR